MKQTGLLTVILAVTLMTFTGCGETEEERRAREQARLDSLRQVEQQKIAEMMAQMEDSVQAAQETVPTAPERETSSSISEEGSYVVQVGAWRSEVKAQRFVDKWADRNYPSSYVVKAGNEETGDIWFRVRVGYFETQEAAQEFGADLAAELDTGFWVANRN